LIFFKRIFFHGEKKANFVTEKLIRIKLVIPFFSYFNTAK